MVLVATIAGGVLIDTAGLLQSQSEETGEASTQQVSDRIQVFSSIGHFSEIDVDVEEGATGDDDNIVVQEGDFSTDPDDAVREGSASEPITGNVVTADGRNVVANGDNVETEDGVDVIREDGETAELDITDTVKVISDGTRHKVFQEDENIIATEGGGGLLNVETENGINVLPAEFAPEAFQEAQIELVVGIGPGSEQVDLDETTIQYVGPDGVTHLVSDNKLNTDQTTFEIETIRGESSHNVLTDKGHKSNIVIDLNDPDEALQVLSENDEVQLTIVAASGAQTQVQLTVPSSIPGEGAVNL